MNPAEMRLLYFPKRIQVNRTNQKPQIHHENQKKTCAERKHSADIATACSGRATTTTKNRNKPKKKKKIGIESTFKYPMSDNNSTHRFDAHTHNKLSNRNESAAIQSKWSTVFNLHFVLVGLTPCFLWRTTKILTIQNWFWLEMRDRWTKRTWLNVRYEAVHATIDTDTIQPSKRYKESRIAIKQHKCCMQHRYTRAHTHSEAPVMHSYAARRPKPNCMSVLFFRCLFPSFIPLTKL